MPGNFDEHVFQIRQHGAKIRGANSIFRQALDHFGDQNRRLGCDSRSDFGGSAMMKRGQLREKALRRARLRWQRSPSAPGSAVQSVVRAYPHRSRARARSPLMRSHNRSASSIRCVCKPKTRNRRLHEPQARGAEVADRRKHRGQVSDGHAKPLRERRGVLCAGS